jgi:probable phosphoglycerate mutase
MPRVSGSTGSSTGFASSPGGGGGASGGPGGVSGARTTTLIWVRHGEADSNRDGRFGGHSPVPLTERGLAQAERTATAILRWAPTALISSDLLRARQTAAPIAAATGLRLELEPDLRERSLGVFDGLSFREAEARYPEVWKRLAGRDHTAVPEGGETVDEVYRRVSAAIDRAVLAHAGGRVVLVSHGLALFHAFAHVTGLGSPSAGHGVFVLVDNCSVSRVEHRGLETAGAGAVRGRWRILTLNDTSHLGHLADAHAAPAT